MLHALCSMQGHPDRVMIAPDTPEAFSLQPVCLLSYVAIAILAEAHAQHLLPHQDHLLDGRPGGGLQARCTRCAMLSLLLRDGILCMCCRVQSFRHHLAYGWL